VKRIGLDIDGVMYQWDRTARYMLREVLPDSPYKEILKDESKSWDWIKGQIAPEHWRWLWNEGIKLGLFRYGNLYSGTIQAIRLLAKKNDVILITHRPQKAVTDTLAWLGLLDLPLAGLHLLTNMEPKSGVRPECDIYLDDKPENIEDLWLNTDGHVCLMRRPWNEHFQLCRDGASTVSNWIEFVAEVERLQGLHRAKWYLNRKLSIPR
jgi:uncharacterized HAD superfamily protein